MHRSPLTQRLTSAGARWVDIDDSRVAADFGDPEAEYAAATRGLALRDASHLSRLEVSGADHVDLLHRLTTNEMRNLQPGEGLINIFTNDKGRIVERVLLLKFSDHLLLVGSPGNNEKLASWIEHYTFLEDVKVHDQTDRTAAVQLIGPQAPAWLQRCVGVEAELLAVWCHAGGTVSGTAVTVVRLGDLWLPSYLVVADADAVTEVWDELRAEGAEAIGESAYDMLRVESGWGAYGRELSESTNPLESGQMPFVNFNKGCYIGQEVVARLDTYDKVQRELVGFEFEAPVSEGSPVFVEENEVGRITSVVRSPSLGKVIGLGYVRRKLAEPGTRVLVRSDRGEVPAQLVELPFVTVKTEASE